MKRVIMALLLFAIAADGVAQRAENFERGFSPQKLYHFNDLDHVNLFNGNLTITLPIGMSYPLGAGMTYGLTLTYNSKLWEFNEVTPILPPGNNPFCCEPWAFPNRRNNAGFGWTLSLGRILDVYDANNNTDDTIYESPDGNDHSIAARSTSSTPQYGADDAYLRWRGDARTLDTPDGLTRQFWPDGTLNYLQDAHGNWMQLLEEYNPQGQLSAWHIIDSAGRSHYVYFKPFNGSTIQHGTTSQTNYRTVVDRVVLQTAGANVTYQFVYTNESGQIDQPSLVNETKFGWAQGWPNQYSLPLLKELRLPDSSKFTAAYITAEQTAYYGEEGAITSLTVPTGGTLSWTYQYYSFPTDGCNTATHDWTYLTTGVKTRTVSTAEQVGTWAYSGDAENIESVNCGNGTFTSTEQATTRTITKPSGNKETYHFGAWPYVFDSTSGISRFEYGHPQNRLLMDSTGTRYLSAEYLDCSSGTCAALKKRYIRYLTKETVQNSMTRAITTVSCTGITSSGGCYDRHSRIESERTLFDDGTYADVDRSDFDGFGHYRQETTGGNFASANARTTYTNYNPGTDANGNRNGVFAFLPSDRWILGTYDQVWSNENGHTTKTEYLFEASTGFLQRVRKLKNDASSAAALQRSVNDVVIAYGKNEDASDTYGNTTSEKYFGGDTATVATGTLSTIVLGTPAYDVRHTYSHGVLQTSRYYDNGAAMPFKHVDRTIDLSGTITADKDSTGQYTTTYTYDTAGRLSTITPPAGLANTTYSYTNANGSTPAQVTITSGGNSTTYAYDGMGRVRTESRTLPGAGLVRRVTGYDTDGRVAFTTVWDTALVPTPRTSYAYDALDRPTSVAHPDNTSMTYAYSGPRHAGRTRQTGANDVTTCEEYDRQGRLYRVRDNVKPDCTSVGATADLTTTYTYDVGSRLAGVSMPSDAGTQTRTFTYDNRGFLTSETHPELGVSGNGTTSYVDAGNADPLKRGYDARGHVHRRITGSFDLTFAYDAAERVTLVTETNTARTLKQYVFDDPTGATIAFCADGSCRGKLAATAKYHYDPDLAPGTNVAVIETYQYYGLGGRESRRDTTIGTTSAFTGASFFYGIDYNNLGRVNTLTYPCRNVSNACAANERQRVLSHGYTNDALTSIGVAGNSGAYASGITYQPSGVPNTIPHANGTREVWSADAYKLPRPSSISVLNSTNVTLWSTGAYTYDGSGNITQIGNTTATHTNYAYDAFNRLTGSNTSNPDGSFNWTGMGYDTYGNWLYNVYSFCGPNGPTRHCGGSSVYPAQLVGTTNHYVGPSYDDAGNLVADGSYDYARTFTFDATGVLARSLVRGHDYRFLYNAAGERVAAVERVTGSDNIVRNKTTFTLRGSDNQLLSTWVTDPYTNAFSWTEDDIWRGAHLLARETPSGTQHYSLDHLGSPRLITNTSGLQVGTQQYAPFGGGGTTGSGMLQFTGQERDAANLGAGEYGLPDYFHARYYDANATRFLSADPIVEGDRILTSPQMWNRYAYVLNNPLTFTDPTGLYVINCEQRDKPCLMDAKAFEEARQRDLKSDDPAVRRGALAFGDPGVVNGVTVSFGDPGKGLGGSAKSDILGNVNTGGMMFTSDVTMRSGMRGAELAAAVAHEGTHVADAFDLYKTFAPGAAFYARSANITREQTETNAYRVSAAVASTWKPKTTLSYGDCGSRPCATFTSRMTPAQIDRAIANFLTHTLTPEERQKYIVPRWAP